MDYWTLTTSCARLQLGIPLLTGRDKYRTDEVLGTPRQLRGWQL